MPVRIHVDWYAEHVAQRAGAAAQLKAALGDWWRPPPESLVSLQAAGRRYHALLLGAVTSARVLQVPQTDDDALSLLACRLGNVRLRLVPVENPSFPRTAADQRASETDNLEEENTADARPMLPALEEEPILTDTACFDSLARLLNSLAATDAMPLVGRDKPERSFASLAMRGAQPMETRTCTPWPQTLVESCEQVLRIEDHEQGSIVQFCDNSIAALRKALRQQVPPDFVVEPDRGVSPLLPLGQIAPATLFGTKACSSRLTNQTWPANVDDEVVVIPMLESAHFSSFEIAERPRAVEARLLAQVTQGCFASPPPEASVPPTLRGLSIESIFRGCAYHDPREPCFVSDAVIASRVFSWQEAALLTRTRFLRTLATSIPFCEVSSESSASFDPARLLSRIDWTRLSPSVLLHGNRAIVRLVIESGERRRWWEQAPCPDDSLLQGDSIAQRDAYLSALRWLPTPSQLREQCTASRECASMFPDALRRIMDKIALRESARIHAQQEAIAPPAERPKSPLAATAQGPDELEIKLTNHEPVEDELDTYQRVMTGQISATSSSVARGGQGLAVREVAVAPSQPVLDVLLLLQDGFAQTRAALVDSGYSAPLLDVEEVQACDPQVIAAYASQVSNELLQPLRHFGNEVAQAHARAWVLLVQLAVLSSAARALISSGVMRAFARLERFVSDKQVMRLEAHSPEPLLATVREMSRMLRALVADVKSGAVADSSRVEALQSIMREVPAARGGGGAVVLLLVDTGMLLPVLHRSLCAEKMRVLLVERGREAMLELADGSTAVLLIAEAASAPFIAPQHWQRLSSVVLYDTEPQSVVIPESARHELAAHRVEALRLVCEHKTPPPKNAAGALPPGVRIVVDERFAADYPPLLASLGLEGLQCSQRFLGCETLLLDDRAAIVVRRLRDAYDPAAGASNAGVLDEWINSTAALSLKCSRLWLLLLALPPEEAQWSTVNAAIVKLQLRLVASLSTRFPVEVHVQAVHGLEQLHETIIAAARIAMLESENPIDWAAREWFSEELTPAEHFFAHFPCLSHLAAQRLLACFGGSPAAVARADEAELLRRAGWLGPQRARSLAKLCHDEFGAAKTLQFAPSQDLEVRSREPARLGLVRHAGQAQTSLALVYD
jgi:hypothetical protein